MPFAGDSMPREHWTTGRAGQLDPAGSAARPVGGVPDQVAQAAHRHQALRRAAQHQAHRTAPPAELKRQGRKRPAGHQPASQPAPSPSQPLACTHIVRSRARQRARITRRSRVRGRCRRGLHALRAKLEARNSQGQLELLSQPHPAALQGPPDRRHRQPRRAAVVRLAPREARGGGPVRSDPVRHHAPSRNLRLSPGRQQPVQGHQAIPARGARTVLVGGGDTQLGGSTRPLRGRPGVASRRS